MYPESHRQTPNVSAGTNSKKGLVVHHTAGAYAGAVSWLTDRASKVSAHVVIARDGRRCVLASDDQITWHAGRGHWHGMQPNPNYHTLGVEFELTAEEVENKALLSNAQIESFKEWLRPRWRKYGWTLEDVTHHAAIDPRKIDLSLQNWALVHQAVKQVFREQEGDGGDVIYRVQIGAFSSRERAEDYARTARSAGFEAIIKKDE